MQIKQDIIGVILAAGKGTRAAPISQNVPKPLMPVANQAVISHQLRLFVECGIHKFIIVIGHQKDLIVDYVAKNHADLNIEFVEQTERLGIAHAILQLESKLQSPFLLFLGDIFFIADQLPRMIQSYQQIESTRGVCGLGTRFEADGDLLARNYLVVADEHQRVNRVIEKPQGYSSGLKGVGVYLFDASIFSAIRRTPRSARRNEYEITDSIQTLIDDGATVMNYDVIDWDVNITYARDIIECNLQYLRHIGQSHLIAPTARVAPDVSIIRSVVGARAHVGAGASLQRCVVFDDSVVPDGAELYEAVVAPWGVVTFNQSLDKPTNA